MRRHDDIRGRGLLERAAGRRYDQARRRERREFDPYCGLGPRDPSTKVTRVRRYFRAEVHNPDPPGYIGPEIVHRLAAETQREVRNNTDRCAKRPFASISPVCAFATGLPEDLAESFVRRVAGAMKNPDNKMETERMVLNMDALTLVKGPILGAETEPEPETHA